MSYPIVQGSYSGSNNSNTIYLDIGPVRIWYSYRTPIAFQSPIRGFVMRKNDWSNTTGKHMNMIEPNHDIRLDADDFLQELEGAMKEAML